MRALLGTLGAAWAIRLAACGGSAPPPRPAAADRAAVPLDSPAAGGGGGGAQAPEPAASPELLAGIKSFDAGAYGEARKSFEAATRKNPNDHDAFYNLGMACEKLGDRAAAEGAYKSALALKPDLAAAAAELSALYLDEARPDDAMNVAQAGLAKRPGSASLHENLGVALATRGDQEGALREFGEAVKLQSSEPMFHLTMAHWLNVWKIRGAAAHLDAARDVAKDDYGMIASIGHEYRMAGEFDACLKTFDRAVQMKDGGEVRTERALCRHGLNDDKGTLDDLQAAVAREPSYAPAHFYLGGRLAVAKRFKDAAAEYAKYLELAPAGSLVKAANERMKAAQDAAKSGGVGAKKK
jgi:tetratricopeptide (TPR) repeat protein